MPSTSPLRDLLAALTATLCLGLTACGGESEPAPEGPAPSEDATPDEPEEAPEPRFTGQTGWESVPPSNSMRMLEFKLLGGEDIGDATLAISRWPTGVGDIELNIKRWIGQVGGDQAPSDLGADQRWLEESGDFIATVIHVEGAIEAQPDAGLEVEGTGNDAILAAYIERPGSMIVWTAKVTGPAATIQEHRDRFVAMIRSL